MAGCRAYSLSMEKPAKIEQLHPGAVFVFIGLDPNTRFLSDLIELDDWGFIRTFDNMQTSSDGIFCRR